MSDTAKTRTRETAAQTTKPDSDALICTIGRMTELADCALNLIVSVRYQYLECAEGKEAEMRQQLCYDYRRIRSLLRSADILLEDLRAISAEATGEPSEPIQV